MKKYALFYHIWCPEEGNAWQLLIDEQIKKIISCKLKYNADIYCCISGKKHKEVEEFIKIYDFIKILESTEDESEYEALTLKHLYDKCVENEKKSDTDKFDAVCYIHTKGIRHFCIKSNPNTLRSINSWRHFLEYGVLDRWKDCVSALYKHDVAGVNFHLAPLPHFQGNFWWATSEYIASLEHPTSRFFGEECFDDPEWIPRLSCEMWIGSKLPKWFTLYGYPFQIDEKSMSYDLYNHDIFPFYLNNSM
ncbi:hypothetical protein [Gluconobacter japonicus]|uniref:hypothetical protein n=1 Tax=Gluconobacter japonicus TaxID=376620 RepID=UPI000A5712C9|nr:hypothetical protein [Gluconobacter japonicus]